jgi:hemerythrin-like domain-containing protein
VCEYGGCQSLTAIDELTREHSAALDLLRQGRSAVEGDDGPAAVETCRRLLELLGPHTAVEEGALFPAMAREHPEHVEVLTLEHEVVHSAFADIASGGTGADAWPHRFAAALDVLSEHIYKEQDGLFPAALIGLDSSDWDLVEDVRARVGSALQPSAGA